MKALFRRLFDRTKKTDKLAALPSEVLLHIKTEADHLAAAVEATRSADTVLSDEDTERLKQLTKTLEDINKDKH